MKRVRFVCVQRKKKPHTATEKKQINKQTNNHGLQATCGWTLLTEPGFCKKKTESRAWWRSISATTAKQSSRTTTTTPELKVLSDGVVWSFLSDEEKTVWRDDILDDVPRFSGIFLPSFFVLPLSSSNPPSAAATPRNNCLKASADPAIRWREQQQEKTRLIRQEIHRFSRYSFEADS